MSLTSGRVETGSPTFAANTQTEIQLDASGNLKTSAASSENGATSTRTTLTPSATSQTLIAASAGRKGLRIVYSATDASERLYFSTGTASTTSFFISIIGSGEFSLYDSKEWAYTGAWTVISGNGTNFGTLQIFQLTA